MCMMESRLTKILYFYVVFSLTGRNPARWRAAPGALPEPPVAAAAAETAPRSGLSLQTLQLVPLAPQNASGGTERS